MQRRSTRVAGLACLALLIAVQAASAMMPAPAPIPERVVRADLIIIGKVAAIEDRTVSVERFAGSKDKTQYGVAVIDVVEGLIGAKGLTKVRLGFIPPPAPKPGLLIKFRSYVPTVGQEACFLLTKHPVGDFYEAGLYSVLDKNGKDTEQIKRCAKLLADPEAGLKSENATDRFLTASMLINRYRATRIGNEPTKSEPIDAAQSKRLLEILAAADWNTREPLMLFFRLGLTAQDGWTAPKDPKEQSAAAQKWLKENAARYRILKLVPEKAEKK
jgi:hypothetical protein